MSQEEQRLLLEPGESTRTLTSPSSNAGHTSASKLLLQTPEGFDARYGAKALVNTEALEIDRSGKRRLSTSVIELLPTVMSVMDHEFGVQIEGELKTSGVTVITGVGVKAAS